MTRSGKEEKTISYYDQHAHDWAAANGGYEAKSYWHEEMARFQELLPTGNIIEIGSGAGKDAAALISRGYNYTGTDASRGLIAVAQKRNPQATFINASVDKLDFPKESFAGFWCTATLLHISKNRIDSALQSIRKVVKKGGFGFITMKAGAGERIEIATQRLYAFYSLKNFAIVLKNNGFETISQETKKGKNDHWLIYFVRRT